MRIEVREEPSFIAEQANGTEHRIDVKAIIQVHPDGEEVLVGYEMRSTGVRVVKIDVGKYLIEPSTRVTSDDPDRV